MSENMSDNQQDSHMLNLLNDISKLLQNGL